MSAGFFCLIVVAVGAFVVAVAAAFVVAVAAVVEGASVVAVPGSVEHLQPDDADDHEQADQCRAARCRREPVAPGPLGAEAHRSPGSA